MRPPTAGIWTTAWSVISPTRPTLDGRLPARPERETHPSSAPRPDQPRPPTAGRSSARTRSRPCHPGRGARLPAPSTSRACSRRRRVQPNRRCRHCAGPRRHCHACLANRRTSPDSTPNQADSGRPSAPPPFDGSKTPSHTVPVASDLLPALAATSLAGRGDGRMPASSTGRSLRERRPPRLRTSRRRRRAAAPWRRPRARRWPGSPRAWCDGLRWVISSRTRTCPSRSRVKAYAGGVGALRQGADRTARSLGQRGRR